MNTRTLMLLITAALVSGCGRHVDDRMARSQAPALVEVPGYGPGPTHATIATREVPKARVVGNYVLVTNGREPVFVMPRGHRYLDEQSIATHQEGVDAVRDELEEIQRAVDRALPAEDERE